MSVKFNNHSEFDKALLNSLNTGCDTFIIYNELRTSELIEIFLNSFDLNVQISQQRKGLRKFIYIFEQNGDILVKKLFSFSNILRNIPELLVIYSDSDFISKEIFLTKWNIENFSTIYKLVTKRIDSSEPVLLDYWNSDTGTFRLGTNLFPDKVNDMNGFELNVSVVYYPPYNILKNDIIVHPYEIPKDVVEGIEIRVLREFANRYNITLNMRLEPDLWGEVYENRTGYGLFGSLVENKIDIGIGAIGSWLNINPYMESSYPFVRTGVSCLVPVPRLLDKFNVPVLPFTGKLWAAVIFSTIALTITFNIVSRISQNFMINENNPSPSKTSTKQLSIRQLFSELPSTIFIIYGMTFLQPLPQSAEHKNVSFRNLLTWILLETLLISTAYSSGLSAIMTLPRYEKPIKTVKDLTESNIEWGANDEAWLYTISGSKDPNMRKLISHFRAYSDEKLEKIAPLRIYAYSIERLPGGSYAVGDYVTEKNVMGLQSMIEDIYWEQCAAVFRKSSPFAPYFNQMIFRLKDSGVLYAIEMQVALKHLSFLVQQRVRLSVPSASGDHGDDNNEPVILQMADLQGVFTFWCFGMLVSIIRFIYEYFNFRYNNIRKQLI